MMIDSIGGGETRIPPLSSLSQGFLPGMSSLGKKRAWSTYPAMQHARVQGRERQRVTNTLNFLSSDLYISQKVQRFHEHLVEGLGFEVRGLKIWL